jgi:hypothetical protein
LASGGKSRPVGPAFAHRPAWFAPTGPFPKLTRRAPLLNLRLPRAPPTLLPPWNSPRCAAAAAPRGRAISAFRLCTPRRGALTLGVLVTKFNASRVVHPLIRRQTMPA